MASREEMPDVSMFNALPAKRPRREAWSDKLAMFGESIACAIAPNSTFTQGSANNATEHSEKQVYTICSSLKCILRLLRSMITCRKLTGNVIFVSKQQSASGNTIRNNNTNHRPLRVENDRCN